MNKHTPGPWKLADAVPRAIVQDNGAKGEAEENLLWLNLEGYPIVGKIEDARLIAAAPDLCYALTVLLRAIRDELAGSSMSKRIVTLDEAIELSESAIAKAEGDD